METPSDRVREKWRKHAKEDIPPQIIIPLKVDPYEIMARIKKDIENRISLIQESEAKWG